MDLNYSAFNYRLRLAIGYIHLVYLGLLPSLATFTLLYKYGYPIPLLLFLGGAVAVSVYIAVILFYTPMPGSVGWGLWILLDGPILVVLSLLTKKSFAIDYVVEGFIVEGTAIWLSILILAARFPRQRLAAIGYMLLSLTVSLSLVYPYFQNTIHDQWASFSLLAIGIVESFGVRFKQLRRDEKGRDKAVTDLNKNVVLLVIL